MESRPHAATAHSHRHPRIVLLTALALSVPILSACDISDLFVQEPYAPFVGHFAPRPPEIHEGAMTTLEWSVSGYPYPSVTIDQDTGVTGYSWLDVTPAATTSYELFASNARGTATATTTVIVHPPAAPDALEPDDDAWAAIPIGSSSLSPIRTITPGDVDWYTFTLDGPGFVTVWLQTEALGSLLLPRYAVLDAELVPLALYGDGLLEEDQGERPLELGAGSYFVVVSGQRPGPTFDGAHQRAGTYRLVVSAVTE
jgi:hypothetical protein